MVAVVLSNVQKIALNMVNKEINRGILLIINSGEVNHVVNFNMNKTFPTRCRRREFELSLNCIAQS